MTQGSISGKEEKGLRLCLLIAFMENAGSDLVHVEEKIHRQDLEGFQIDPGDIVLLKTRNSTLGYVKFLENYVHLKMDAAEYLVEAGVKTLGFDYLRVSKPEEQRG